MPAKKMRVEVFDDQGNRYIVTFEGKVTREKALGMLDIIELLGGVQGQQGVDANLTSLSKFDKIRSLLGRRFPLAWFSSKEVLSAYEQEFQEPLSLSTVSTYLARMTDRGLLTKTNVARSRKYRLFDKRLAGNLETHNTYR